MAVEHAEATDEMLIVRYQRGDREAFAQLVQRHHESVYNFALCQGKQPTLAENLTEEAFLRVARNAVAFKHEARFTTGLYSIVQNLCANDHKERARASRPNLQQKTLEEPAADATASADETSRSRAGVPPEVTRAVRQAIDSLPPEQRDVLLLRQVAKLPFKEIALVTGAMDSTVKSHLRHALDVLYEALSDFEEYARALR